jgi:hypothetical protein
MDDYDRLLDLPVPRLDLPGARFGLEKLALSAAQLTRAGRAVDLSATKPQHEAGNYRKGHVRWKGLEITVETPARQYRSGVSKSGKPWKKMLRDHYGYVRGSKGADGDHVDCFIRDYGSELESELVFVVNQVDPSTKEFDEHKCVLGCIDEKTARETYLRNYEDGWKGLGSITAMTVGQFRWWLEHADTKKEILDGFWAHPALRKKSSDKEAGSYDEKKLARCRDVVGKFRAEGRDLDGIYAYANNDLGIVWVDVMDWGDGKAGGELGEKLKRQGYDLVMRNEAGKPRGPGWVQLLPEPDKEGADLNSTIEKPPYLLLVKQADRKRESPFTIAVDLDGTVCEKQEPFNAETFGGPRERAVYWLRLFRAAGARIIIFTVRGDTKNVEDWLDENDVPYDYVNENPDQPENSSGKVWADAYIDDRAVDGRDPEHFGPEVLGRILQGRDDNEVEHKPCHVSVRETTVFLVPADVVLDTLENA